MSSVPPPRRHRSWRYSSCGHAAARFRFPPVAPRPCGDWCATSMFPFGRGCALPRTPTTKLGDHSAGHPYHRHTRHCPPQNVLPGFVSGYAPCAKSARVAELLGVPHRNQTSRCTPPTTAWANPRALLNTEGQGRQERTHPRHGPRTASAGRSSMGDAHRVIHSPVGSSQSCESNHPDL
jgi:hypothetical protein